MGMLDSVRRHAGLLCGPLETQVVRVDGTLVGSQSALQLRYSGSGASLPFLTKLLFSDSKHQLLRINQLPPFGDRNAFTEIDRRRADLIVIERPPAWHLLSMASPELSIPAWIQQVIELPDTPTQAASVLPRVLAREVARHVRRSGLELDFTRDIAAKREFFHQLYQPHVSRRFGTGAVRVSEEFFLSQAHDHELARLRHRGDWIAGVLLERRETTLRFGWFGARAEPAVPGASEVLDALIIEKAAAEGVKLVLFGRSRPSLADGVVRYKRRFGAQVRATRFPQPVLNLHVSRWTVPLATRLNDARLIGVRRAKPFLHQIIEQDGLFRVQQMPLPDDARKPQ